jgi:hypothetical protein
MIEGNKLPISLPCWIGDVVWLVNFSQQKIFLNTVDGIYITGVGKNSNTVRLEYVNKLGEKQYRKFTWAQFGKTIFFTREEAESALNRRKEVKE